MFMLKLIIVGRSCTGKSTLAGMLAEKGLTVLKSYAVRKPRWDSEDSYHFITEEEASAMENKVLETVIRGTHYFTTAKDIMESDVLILDPKGMKEAAELFSEIAFRVVYLTMPDLRERIFLALQRERKEDSDLIELEETIKGKFLSEDENFRDFEAIIREGQGFGIKNIQMYYSIINSGDENSDMLRFPDEFMSDYTAFRRIQTIVSDMTANNILEEKNGCVLITYRTPENKLNEVPVPKDVFTDMVLLDGDNMIFRNVVNTWLHLPDITALQ